MAFIYSNRSNRSRDEMLWNEAINVQKLMEIGSQDSLLRGAGDHQLFTGETGDLRKRPLKVRGSAARTSEKSFDSCILSVIGESLLSRVSRSLDLTGVSLMCRNDSGS